MAYKYSFDFYNVTAGSIEACEFQLWKCTGKNTRVLWTVADPKKEGVETFTEKKGGCWYTFEQMKSFLGEPNAQICIKHTVKGGLRNKPYKSLQGVLKVIKAHLHEVAEKKQKNRL